MAQVKYDPSAIGLTTPASLIPREAGTQGTDTSRSLELETLSDIAQILSGVGGFEEKATQVAARMAQAAAADWAVLRIPDDYALGLELIASVGGVFEQSPPPQVLPYGQGMFGRAFEAEKSIIAHDYPNHPSALSRQVAAGTKSTLALPLLLDGRVIGVFLFGSRELGHFTDDHVALMEAVARRLSPLLENAKLQQMLAVTDGIALIITSYLEVDEVFEQFATEVNKLVEFDRIVIHAINEQAGTSIVKFRKGIGPPGSEVGSVRQLRHIQSRELVTTGKTVVVNDLADSPRYPLDREYIQAGLNSAIIVPLVSHSRLIGAFTLRSQQTNAFGMQAQMLLERLAKQIAPAIENTQLYEARKKAEEEERQAAKESRVMAEIGKVITSSLNIDEVYGRLTEEIGNLIPFDRISVTIIDPTHGVTRPTYIAGIDVLDRQPGDNIPISGTMTEEVARSRLPKMLVAEHEDDLSSRFPGLVPAFRSGLRSFLGVPLVDHDEVIGVLQIKSKVPGVYSQRHLDLAERIGNQIAGSIANAQLYEQTRQAEAAERMRSEELEVLFEVASILAQAGNFDQKAASVMQKLANSPARSG